MNRYFVKLLEDRNHIYVYADNIIEFEGKYLLLRNNEVIAMMFKNNVDFVSLDDEQIR